MHLAQQSVPELASEHSGVRARTKLVGQVTLDANQMGEVVVKRAEAPGPCLLVSPCGDVGWHDHCSQTVLRRGRRHTHRSTPCSCHGEG